ncbi:AOC03_06830 family ribosome hibernation factor [Leptolyngbya iicbica]|uniref:Chemotaxis protein n=2 Tax=Cyanophyceae TaxID=3028117 RepID=A0A4Q7EDX1_9CYAN|nr:hypothetical protein [Leptolyngbya sp. LK]RZM79425.1 hypothetical protein DYY88_11830 [Leptolyngbya sp. LK]
MITRHDLKALQSMVSVPALSILLPTYRHFPDHQKDPIRVKNLVDEARERLSQEFDKRDIEPLLIRLETLVADIDYNHTLDGLALFVSHDVAKKFYLPFPVPERVIIDQTFATRDLLYGMHRMVCYWVFLLSQNATRLIAGTGETLEEVFDDRFPMQMTGPAATEPIPYEADTAYVDDRFRRFFQQVDRAFAAYAQDEPKHLPLILGGVKRQISFFREVSEYKGDIVGTLTGSHDRATLAELTPDIWAIAQTIRQQRHDDALQALDRAMSQQKVVSAIEEVWRLANDGRGQLLLVEKNYHVPAVVTENGGLKTVAEPGGTDVMDDAVDEIIEAVLLKGGEVELMDDGELANHQKIALILRY